MQGEFQMYIRAYDEDPGILLDDLLDNIFIEMQQEESDNFTANEQFTGEMNKVSVNMSFRVSMCPDNLYGVNCDVMCIAQNDDINGYYTCNGDGSIQCRPGFHNVSNNCRDGKFDILIPISYKINLCGSFRLSLEYFHSPCVGGRKVV